MARAAALAETMGAELLVAHAYAPGSDALGTDRDDVSDAKHLLLKAEHEHGGRITIRSILRRGEAAAALLDVAREESADLIVVGNKGMAGAQRFLLGSVPNRVSHHAPIDVLIVHTTK